MSSSNGCFLTCIQISQEAGQVIWYSHLSQNFPQFIVMHTVKGFGIVNQAEIDVFLELSCFFHDPADVGSLISDSSAFSKTSLNIWKFIVHIQLKPGLENFEHYFTSIWDEYNCAIVWTVMLSHEILFSFIREGSPAVCSNMDETWGYYAKWNNPGTQGQFLGNVKWDDYYWFTYEKNYSWIFTQNID